MLRPLLVLCTWLDLTAFIEVHIEECHVLLCSVQLGSGLQHHGVPAAFSPSISDISLPSPDAMIQLAKGSHLSLDTCLIITMPSLLFLSLQTSLPPIAHQQTMQHSHVFQSCPGSSFPCLHPHPSTYSSVGIPYTHNFGQD